MKSLLISMTFIAFVVIFATTALAEGLTEKNKAMVASGGKELKPVTDKERAKILKHLQQKALEEIKQRLARRSEGTKTRLTPAQQKELEQLRQEFIRRNIIPYKKTTETEASPKMAPPLEIMPLAPDAWCQEECLEVSSSQCTGYSEQWRLNDCNVPIYKQCYEWCLQNAD
jgi:hypothetical protein